MVLHSSVIALILGSGVVLLLILSAAALGIRILLKWDIKSSSEEQLSLERKTYLVSTLVQYALGFEILSTLLFLYTADDIHYLLVGAMCATGSLNANPYGFPTLYAKVAALFISASWIAINYLDSKAEDYPLTMTKYKFLLFVVLVVIVESVLQFLYFLNVNPDVITSCCGFLFSEGGRGLGSSLASLPILPAKITFYSLLTISIVLGITTLKTSRKPFTFLFSISSFLFFIVSVISIIAFISLHFYQLPTHHCPFDILQGEYYYIGYPLYVTLFGGCFFGMMVGAIEPFKNISSLSVVIPQVQRRWSLRAVVGITLFAMIATAPMVFLPFTLEGY
ncbi:MAG: hypothetical protein AB1488_05305 [Nitrospirota bacterium]